VGVLWFTSSYINDKPCTLEESLFFITITFTTVGYGTITECAQNFETERARIFLIFYIISGTAIIMVGISYAIDDFATSWTSKIVDRKSIKVFLPKKTMIDYSEKPTLIGIIPSVLIWFVVLFGGSWAVIVLDKENNQENKDKDFSILDILYFGVVTGSSVGFGDINPSCKYLCCVWIPMVVILTAYIFTRLFKYVFESAVHFVEADIQTMKKVIRNILRNFDAKMFEDMDIDGSGTLSQAEFIIHFLINIYDVDYACLEILKEIFRRIAEVGHNEDVITIEDIHLIEHDPQLISAASKFEFKNFYGK